MENGYLFLSLYNDQGGTSKRWHLAKRVYNNLPKIIRPWYAVMIMGPRELKFFILNTLKLKPWQYFKEIINYSKNRGMSYWHDLIDWIGGYPFEVSTPQEVVKFYHDKQFTLQSLNTCGGGHGCNQYVFINSLTRQESDGVPLSC